MGRVSVALPRGRPRAGPEERVPTTPTHALAGVALAAALAPAPAPPWYYALAAALALLPDADVVAFPLGIPYRSRFGHRGLSHSLFLAALAALVAAAATAGALGVLWWRLSLTLVAVTASHTLLDAMTDGGLGVALFAPFDDRRYFLPWRPVRVSPIGLGVFSRWGLRALLSEVVWVWLPLAALVGLSSLLRGGA
jgi:inner membrane protein